MVIFGLLLGYALDCSFTVLYQQFKLIYLGMVVIASERQRLQLRVYQRDCLGLLTFHDCILLSLLQLELGHLIKRITTLLV